MTLFFAPFLIMAQAASPSLPPQTSLGMLPGPPVCLTRKFKDSKEKDKELTIIVPVSALTTLTGKGFKSVDCKRLAAGYPAYRDSVCRMAAAGNGAVQSRYEEVLGVRPDELCAATEMLTSPVQ